jgi:UDP-N-acetylglucosamine diphosphorylase / glucose-1-phosphate thymidylyltransferase / UDP-N-acetylgalactosamine diphosphorylase / glucosamine-1-phosphate N-acetyltransferase / galactosamine-1-phosphate N-acetyltransferase
MKTLLLLAGQSKRFWPLYEKPLFPVCGDTLLGHVIERLEKGGCTGIILIGSKNNLEQAHALFPDFPTVEQKNLEQGMRGALLAALPSIGSEDILIVSSNDIIDSSGYHATVEAGKQKGTDGALLAQTVSEYFPGGYLSITDKKISGIVEKPGKGKEPSNLVNIVCHYHSDAAVLLETLQKTEDSKDDGYEQALDAIFKIKHYAPVAYSESWQAVKYPWHLLHLLPIILSDIKKPRIDSSAQIHESVVIEGNVIIEEGVRVLPHATIVGPAFIGRHSIIGNNALVRGSSIGEHCVVGYNTEVKGSILHSHVWTHSTYIGDSVIGRNVSFGAGSVTGNLRLDEGEITSLVNPSSGSGEKLGTGLTKFGTIIGDDVRIGIRVAINPGLKIGRGTFISSGAIIEKDIPEKSFARVKRGELVIKENSAQASQPAGREQYRKKI